MPIGASGLWWIPDDVATLGNFLLVEGGMINGEQILDPALLQAGLQQNPDDRGVDMPGGKYNNAFWGQRYGSYQGFHCDFYMPYMAGYSGVVIALLPNGVTYYYFSDNREFNWDAALVEADKIALLCPQDG